MRQNAHFALLPFADAAFLTDGRFGATLHQPAWRHSFSSGVRSLPVPVPHIGNSHNIPDFSLLLYFQGHLRASLMQLPKDQMMVSTFEQ